MFQAVLSNVRSLYVSSFNWTWSRLPSLGFPSLLTSLSTCLYRQAVQTPLTDQNRPVEQPPLQEELVEPLKWIKIADKPEYESFCPIGTTYSNFTVWNPAFSSRCIGHVVEGKMYFRPILLTVYDQDSRKNRCQLISVFRQDGVEYCKSYRVDILRRRDLFHNRIPRVIGGQAYRKRILGAVNSLACNPVFRGDQKLQLNIITFQEISYALHGYYKLTNQHLGAMMDGRLSDQDLRNPNLISIVDTLNRLSEYFKDSISGGSRSDIFRSYSEVFIWVTRALTKVLKDGLILVGTGDTVRRSLQDRLDRIQTLYLADQRVFTQVPVTHTARIMKLRNFAYILGRSHLQ